MRGFRLEILNGEPIPYDEPIGVLRSRVRASGSKAGAAIYALARNPKPEAFAILVDLTRSPDPYLRRAALEGIGAHQSGRDAADIVLRMLNDSHGFVVRTACDVAAVLGLAGAHDRILELVSGNNEATQLSALRALESLWVPADFETVFARYSSDRSDDVRKQAAWTLNKNVGSQHWMRVFASWATDPLPRHRAWACSLAERFGDRAVLAKLNALRSDLDGHVRSAAERAARVVGEE
jgi:HEAT repeat protein